MDKIFSLSFSKLVSLVFWRLSIGYCANNSDSDLGPIERILLKSKLKNKGTHYAKALQRYLNYHC